MCSLRFLAYLILLEFFQAILKSKEQATVKESLTVQTVEYT